MREIYVVVLLLSTVMNFIYQLIKLALLKIQHTCELISSYSGRGLVKMVYLKDFADDKHTYLALVDHKDDPPKSGTCLVVRPSLLRPGNRAKSLVSPQNFLSHMSKEIKLDDLNAYVLQNTMPDRDATRDKPPLLGRSIISGPRKWKSNIVKFVGDFSFILGYWEWTEDVLSIYGDVLELCSVYDAVYDSLYSYDRDVNVLRAFCESWCPNTNTLHTMAGELSISLWDLYKLGGLPISGRVYDEAVPNTQTLQAYNKKSIRRIPRACEILFEVYRQIVRLAESKKGVSARQWIDFWCKRSASYGAPLM